MIDVSMATNVEENLEQLEIGVTLEVSSMQLFIKITCPCCSAGTIIQKSYLSEKILCSSKSCRKVITIENFQDIAA